MSYYIVYMLILIICTHQLFLSLLIIDTIIIYIIINKYNIYSINIQLLIRKITTHTHYRSFSKMSSVICHCDVEFVNMVQHNFPLSIDIEVIV